MNSDTVTIDRATYEALLSDARTLRIAATVYPDIATCACRGPLPDCPCVVQNRLINAVLKPTNPKGD